MKKIFSFVLLFAITFASTFMLSACEEHRVIDNLMFTYNRTTYKSGANIVFNYQEEVNFNKQTVKFLCIDNLNTTSNINIQELTVKYECAPVNSTQFIEVNAIPFFEGDTLTPACGTYKFTFGKDDAILQFTVTVLKSDTIGKYNIEFYSNSPDVDVAKQNNTEYTVNASDANKIFWRVSGMSNLEREQLGAYPDLYVMTPEQYLRCSGRSTYTGEEVISLSDILRNPGSYYIYGKFNDTNNFSGGNTIATYIRVV